MTKTNDGIIVFMENRTGGGLMRKSNFKLFAIFCGLALILIPLVGVVSCAKKKPPVPVVEKTTKDEEMRKAEEARKRAEEEERLKAEDEARAKAKEEAKRKAEEARLKAEEEAKKKAEVEEKEAEEVAKAAEEAKAEEEAKAAEEAKAGKEKTSHEVVKGESLWKIAKYKDVYENPFMWPIIYKENHDKIKDPDLIYPKQVFSIPRDFLSGDKDKAVRHAKTRGEWSLHDGPEKYWEDGYKKTK